MLKIFLIFVRNDGLNGWIPAASTELKKPQSADAPWGFFNYGGEAEILKGVSYTPDEPPQDICKIDIKRKRSSLLKKYFE